MSSFTEWAVLALLLSSLANTALATSASPCRPGEQASIKYDTAPRLLHIDSPAYPPNLLNSGNIGDVIVKFQVLPDGHAEDIEVCASPHASLEAAAVDAVLAARFQPALSSDKPVTAAVILPVRFQIREPPGSLVRPTGLLPFHLPATSGETKTAQFQYDEAPEPVLTATPVYPFELARKGLEGEAEVEFVVRRDGFVTQTRILRASHPDFGESTAAMLRAWRFKPARLKGQDTSAILRKLQRFAANDRDSGWSKTERELLDLSAEEQGRLPGLEGLDHAPRARYRPLPEFDTNRQGAAQAAQTITLEFYLDGKGGVHWPHALNAQNNPLAWDASTALARWRFEPPLSAGRPVSAARLRIPFEFAKPGATATPPSP